MSKSETTVTISCHLSPELRFLIACCQAQPDPDEIALQIKSEKLKMKNWEQIVSLASRHGVLPIVYKTMKTLHSSLLTPHSSLEQLLNALKANYQNIAHRNMLMTAELLRIMKLLQENGIEALAFKGPVLSQMAYGDITLRQYGDLDILVDEQDAYRVGKLMNEHGHRPVLPLRILSSDTCLHTAKDFSLLSEKSGVHTELHWRLFERKYNISLFSCAAEKRCQSITINGYQIRTLRNELLLVYLCLHGAKHAFQRIEWICDIDRMIRSIAIDWEEVLMIAERSHSLRSFYLGLSLAHALLHTPVPEGFLAKIHHDEVRMLHAMTLEQIGGSEATTDFEKNRRTFFYQAKLFDTKLDMLRFYISTLFRISTTDCQTFVLPDRLKFLYILLRPLRLLWRYVRR